MPLGYEKLKKDYLKKMSKYILIEIFIASGFMQKKVEKT